MSTYPCDYCHQDYDLDRDNDILTIFLADPSCTYLTSKCSNCRMDNHMFIDTVESTIGFARNLSRIRLAAYPPPEIMMQKQHVYARLLTDDEKAAIEEMEAQFGGES